MEKKRNFLSNVFLTITLLVLIVSCSITLLKQLDRPVLHQSWPDEECLIVYEYTDSGVVEHECDSSWMIEQEKKGAKFTYVWGQPETS